MKLAFLFGVALHQGIRVLMSCIVWEYVAVSATIWRSIEYLRMCYMTKRGLLNLALLLLYYNVLFVLVNAISAYLAAWEGHISVEWDKKALSIFVYVYVVHSVLYALAYTHTYICGILVCWTPAEDAIGKNNRLQKYMNLGVG